MQQEQPQRSGAFEMAKMLFNRLRDDRRGVAFIEFAFSAPLLLAVTCYGMELGTLALARTRVSQATMNLADNMSRVGLDNGLSQVQIRESDVNDSINGSKLAAGGLNLTTHGRIILSSLQRNADGGQWIAWQRCKGLKNVTSSYGLANDGVTGTTVTGMGPTGARVAAPASSAVMFVEVQYDYQPLFPLFWSTNPTPSGFGLKATFNNTHKLIKFSQAFIVRDQRELAVANSSGVVTTPGIRNPNDPLTGAPAPVSNCSTFSA
jgi:hypothetical protein